MWREGVGNGGFSRDLQAIGLLRSRNRRFRSVPAYCKLVEDAGTCICAAKMWFTDRNLMQTQIQGSKQKHGRRA